MLTLASPLRGLVKMLNYRIASFFALSLGCVLTRIGLICRLMIPKQSPQL
jgi:hypothetical protein